MNILGNTNVSVPTAGLYPVNQRNNQPKAFLTAPMAYDSVSISRVQNPSVSFTSGKNFIHLVSFKGLKDPLRPALQMKVTGVTRHQENYDADPQKAPMDTNINDLANSNWKDGEHLNFKVKKTMFGENIMLIHPKYGELGRVPDEIAPTILPVLKAAPQDFKFELSNMIAGTTKGAGTIGLRVNLLYNGENPKMEKEVRKDFSQVLNDRDAAQKVLLYQPKTTPEEVLRNILDQDTKDNGTESAKHMEKAIGAIVKEIDSPDNKRILLISHCKPDGDTIGCSLGLKNAINLVHPQKEVDCAVDDTITGLFRHKLPGVDGTFKQPYSQEKIDNLSSQLEEAKATGKNPKLVKEMEEDLGKLSDKETHLKPNDKYDLVVMLDVPAPARFSNSFKDYIQGANKAIYIDHHPFRKEEWDSSKDKTGADIAKIDNQNLAWIADRVPAAAQMIAVLATKLSPDKNPLSPDSPEEVKANMTEEDKDKLKGFAAALATGISTDTGCYTRTANLLPEDVKDKDGNPVPIQWRPNFQPEGMSKWLFDQTNGDISKKWLREEISYDINDNKTKDIPESARDKMIGLAESGKSEDKDLGLGIISVSYEDMKDVLDTAQVTEPDTNLLDVQNGFKYCEVMGGLRSSMKENPDAEKDEEPGPYDEQKIAVLVCKSQKAGDLDDNGQLIKDDSLRFSFRSQEGTTDAEMLATLFNGGGHGGAAGGNITMDHVDLDSKFAVKINGKKVDDDKAIYEQVKKNYDINHDKHLSSEQRKSRAAKIQIVKDDDGRTAQEIIKDMVVEIRKDEKVDAPKSANRKGGNSGRFGNQHQKRHIA